MRLLVTDAAAQPPRQATAWLIMTLGRRKHIMNTEEGERIQKEQSKGCFAIIGILVGIGLLLHGLASSVALIEIVLRVLRGKAEFQSSSLILFLVAAGAVFVGLILCGISIPVIKSAAWEKKPEETADSKTEVCKQENEN
jgi:hypothetical protein